MSVKLELYRVFKEVAEAGNITAAAQALYISQSAVSQSIKQLEGELQTRLFARNSRGVALTPDGRMLYEYVRSAIGLLETGEEKLSQSRELQMGHLTIGASAIGFGVAGVTEEFVHEELSKGRLRKLATDFEIPPRSVDLCVLRDVPLTPAAQRFADFVKDSLSQRSGAPLNWEN